MLYSKIIAIYRMPVRLLRSSLNYNHRKYSLKKKTLIITAAMALLVLGAALVYFFIGSEENIARCSEIDSIEEVDVESVAITSTGFSPSDITISQCGDLILENFSDETARIAFGPHDSHQEYPGYTEQDLGAGDRLVIPLAQYGEFVIHNHHDNERRLVVLVEKNASIAQYSADALFGDYKKADSNH
jgi:hypothetical protein